MSRPHWDSLGRASGCSRPLATPLQLTLRLLPPVRMHVLSSSRACIRPPSHNRVVTAWPRSMCSCPPRSAPRRRLPPLSACSPSGLIDRAELHSEAQLGARAFLAAVPQGACRMEPAPATLLLRGPTGPACSQRLKSPTSFSPNALMKCAWLLAGLLMCTCLLGTGLPPHSTWPSLAPRGPRPLPLLARSHWRPRRPMLRSRPPT